MITALVCLPENRVTVDQGAPEENCSMLQDTYGHTPVKKAFDLKDVYGIDFDEERASRKKVRLAIIGTGGIAQSKYFPAIARLRMIWEPVEVVAFAEPREVQARKVQ